MTTSSFDERSAEVKEHERRAAVILEGMYQFVALLTPSGDILEVNRAALEGAGHQIEEIRGKPFWTARWWQISQQSQAELQVAIQRAAAGEFVRYEVDIYGEQSGLAPITIDFSLQPIRGESGEVEYLLPEGRNITERKRAEEQVAHQAQELRILNERLKELDRLKTQFFANVSHEFRTPLTLMLGPLEDTLAQPNGLPAEDRAQLEVAHRNSVRLLKLVNTLLDFSRIEAGRLQASYEPTDLPAFTAELASVFRSAIERAGMKLIINCPPLAEPVYVDRELWEKIVLNLLSNAFKFTFAGEIEVSLQQAGESVELVVSDTGTGIPAAELPHLFERFHRVQGARGRTFEGSGIGLALVQELVKLHGGVVRVESEVDRGSCFLVSIPLGKAHLPADRIGAQRTLASTGVRGEAYLEEALGWLPEMQRDERPASEADTAHPMPESSLDTAFPTLHSRILFADDNADLREYGRRLLAQRGYDVEVVADGRAALRAARQRTPDLVLTDVMMPGLDGFELLRALRADERTATVPVILLSARAGEESKVEGLEAGADDYLIKPFSAKELLARVEAHLKLQRGRHEAARAVRASEHRFRELMDALPAAIYTTDAAGHLTHFNLAAAELSGRRPALGTDQWCVSWKLYYPDGTPMPHAECPMAIALKEGRVMRGVEAILERPDGTRIWFEPYPTPLRDSEGRVVGGINMLLDITERKRAEAARAHLAAIVESSDDAIISKSLQGIITSWNQGAEKIFGYTAAEAIGQPVTMLIPPQYVDEEPQILSRIRRGEKVDHYETVRRRKNGTDLDISLTVSPIRDAAGNILGASKIAHDITERKRTEQRLQFLADVSKVLAASLDEEVTLQQVAALMVPQLADACTVEILSAKGTIEPVAAAHRDPHQAHWVRQLRQRYPPALDEPRGIAQVIRTGVAAFYPEIQQERLLQFAQGEEHKTLLRQAGFHSVIIVPLQVRGQTFGALTLVWSTSQHCYTEADLQFAEEVARRAALAVDNARLYRQAREAETQLKQLNATLEHQVEERTAELQRSNRDLDQFAYVASHDLRSPLRGIEHLVNFINEDAADRLPEPSQKHLAILRGRVKRMDTLLTDLLAYSRATRQRHPIERVEPTALVRAVVELLAPPAGFQVNIAEPMPTLMTERLPLESILRNLIDNAIKHHHRPAEGRVTIAAQVVGSFLEFSVTDNGPGIDPVFHDRIFEIFQTLKPRDQVEGSGIGLSVVKRLVESRGGQIGVESSPSQGATFRFTWPL